MRLPFMVILKSNRYIDPIFLEARETLDTKRKKEQISLMKPFLG